MKRRELVRHLARFGCVLADEGAKHGKYVNLADPRLAAKTSSSELKGLLERETFRIEVKIVKPRRKRKAPEIIMQGGKPTAVILSIEEYRDLLERLEDAEDLKMLKTMRKKPLKFRRLEDFLKESPGV